MSGWGGHAQGHSSGSWSEHEPSEERGEAAWAAQEHPAPGEEPVTAPPWASARTQTFSAPSYAPAPTPLPPPVPAAPAAAPPPAPAPTAGPPPVPAPAPVPGSAAVPARATDPASVRPSPRGARRLLLVLTAAAVLGAGVGTGVWFLIRDGAATAANGTTPIPNVVVSTPTATTLDSPSPSPTPAPVPGYRRAQDPVGYTLHVPEGWTRTQRQGEKAPVVSYTSPDGSRSLQIFALAEDTPADSLDLAENDPGYGYSQQPGYQALDRSFGASWSELTYRYDDEDKGARQVIDHRFEAADGTLYAIRAAGPDALAPDQIRGPLTAALESFCPAGASCG
ncbi:hypothetical protein ACHBTE_06140 [Streptomyces sp. M41]|uniref:hypothetical protein n=1 Tax=Streptomyces sp. M41 TaxID=3059412 RepID=UPI00374DC563